MNVEDLIRSSDEELVKLIYKHWNAPEVFNTAQAELIRRQMETTKEFTRSTAELMRNQTNAINRFNASSTRLAWIMIWLTVAIGAIAILQLIAAFRV